MKCPPVKSLRSIRIAFALSTSISIGNTFADVPNITGVWNRYPEIAPGLTDPLPPPPIPPLKEPYLKAFKTELKRRDVAEAHGRALATSTSRCLNEGMPDMMGAHYSIEFLQTPGQVTVLTEFMMQTRRIYLDETAPPLEELTPSYNGYSVGRWDGDVLVVQTTGVREDVPYLGVYGGVPHSAAMKIIERIHLTAKDVLQDDITVIDEHTLTQPFKYAVGYRRENKDYKIMEYVCDHENNVMRSDGSLQFRTDPQPKRPP